jgi:hypothetical protein
VQVGHWKGYIWREILNCPVEIKSVSRVTGKPENISYSTMIEKF